MPNINNNTFQQYIYRSSMQSIRAIQEIQNEENRLNIQHNQITQQPQEIRRQQDLQNTRIASPITPDEVHDVSVAPTTITATNKRPAGTIKGSASKKIKTNDNPEAYITEYLKTKNFGFCVIPSNITSIHGYKIKKVQPYHDIIDIIDTNKEDLKKIIGKDNIFPSFSNLSSMLSGSRRDAHKALKELLDILKEPTTKELIEKSDLSANNLSSMLNGAGINAPKALKELLDILKDPTTNELIKESDLPANNLSSMLSAAGSNAPKALKEFLMLKNIANLKQLDKTYYPLLKSVGMKAPKRIQNLLLIQEQHSNGVLSEDIFKMAGIKDKKIKASLEKIFNKLENKQPATHDDIDMLNFFVNDDNDTVAQLLEGTKSVNTDFCSANTSTKSKQVASVTSEKYAQDISHLEDINDTDTIPDTNNFLGNFAEVDFDLSLLNKDTKQLSPPHSSVGYVDNGSHFTPFIELDDDDSRKPAFVVRK